MDSQKWEEHSDSGIIGGIENNELDKTLLSFMIVWLKDNVPYIIKSIPEQNIDGKWIKEQILDFLKNFKKTVVLGLEQEYQMIITLPMY